MKRLKDTRSDMATTRATHIMALVDAGFTAQQLADHLGISLSSVDNTVRRARKRAAS